MGSLPSPPVGTMHTSAFLSYGLAVLAMLQDSVSASCKGTEQCVGIRTCPSIVEQLTRAKNTEDADRRELIIKDIRKKVCGEKRERKVCCESEGAPVTALAQDDTMKKIGTFSMTLLVLPMHWMTRPFSSRTSHMMGRGQMPS